MISIHSVILEFNEEEVLSKSWVYWLVSQSNDVTQRSTMPFPESRYAATDAQLFQDSCMMFPSSNVWLKSGCVPSGVLQMYCWIAPAYVEGKRLRARRMESDICRLEK